MFVPDLCALCALCALTCFARAESKFVEMIVKASLCLRLLPSAAAVSSTAGRGVQRVTYCHHSYRRPFAFGWAPGDTSRHTAATAAAAAAPAAGVAGQQDHELRELKDVPASLLEVVEAVASDVDGTLTTPEVTVTSRTKQAIKAVMDSGLVFFPATGKTRAGMYKILGEDVSAQLKAKDTPGVFIQGLVVYSGAGDEVLYERLLDAETVSQVTSFCEERGVSLIAYSGDSIVCSTKDAETDKIALYSEPMPSAVGPLPEAMAAGLRIHKLILMDKKEAIDRVRPDVERLVGERATFTQALPDMLEVLPPGASKGHGVEVLLKHLGIDPQHLMALGDAENDVEMLRLAGVGVCVGNASPPAKAAARYVAPTNADDGSAVAMEQLLRNKKPGSLEE
ncbi:unnamed protein product [Pylaiella littoralis]